MPCHDTLCISTVVPALVSSRVPPNIDTHIEGIYPATSRTVGVKLSRKYSFFSISPVNDSSASSNLRVIFKGDLERNDIFFVYFEIFKDFTILFYGSYHDYYLHQTFLLSLALSPVSLYMYIIFISIF